MSLTSDGIGNYFLGNAIYKNSILDPNNYYLQSETASNGYVLFDQLRNALNYPIFTFGNSQNDWDNFVSGSYAYKFGYYPIALKFLGDTLNKERFLVTPINGVYGPNQNLKLNYNALQLNANGYTFSGTNFLVSASQNSFIFSSFNLLKYPLSLTAWGAIRLTTLNSNQNLYQDNQKYLVFSVHSSNSTPLLEWVNPSENKILFSGNADFNITCLNTQIPSSNWLTDFIMFHNAPNINNPWIGKSDNLLKLGQGTFTNGGVYQCDIGDGGSPYWMALSKWTVNKTLFCRVNSIV